MLDRRTVRARAAGVLLLTALALSRAPAVRANGVDGAGRIVVIPLVTDGQRRWSLVTLTNPGPHPIRIEGLYVGAEGTPFAASKVGVWPCQDTELRPDSSVTLRLAALCNLPPPDIDNVGYLELTAFGDSQFTFLATSAVENDRLQTFSVAGQPAGAFDPSAFLSWFGLPLPGLAVAGLRSPAAPLPGVPASETLNCYVASLTEPKAVILSLLDASGTLLGSKSLLLKTREMSQMVDVLSMLGVPAGARDPLRVELASPDSSRLVAGCGLEVAATRMIAYQPAQTPAPRDAARLRSVGVHEAVDSGPYLIGNPVVLGRKVVLSTYLRWEDKVRCFLTPSPNPNSSFDPTFWLEMQVKTPSGTVVAGGTGAKGTGLFQTGHRDRPVSARGQRWLIEISFDEAALATVPWPGGSTLSYWGMQCDSAAGMSKPLPIGDLGIDDF